MEMTFLNGKVVKRSLPMIAGRPPADAPRLKRLVLSQGELAQLYDDERGIRYIAGVELRPGAIRGNHYHHVKEEFLYLITGEIELAVEDIQSKERVQLSLIEGDLAVIPVGIAHAVRTIRTGHAIEFSPAKFDPLDVQSYSLF